MEIGGGGGGGVGWIIEIVVKMLTFAIVDPKNHVLKNSICFYVVTEEKGTVDFT
jgi:hypothetical protein